MKVIEGRGYDADGNVSFNALCIVSYDPDSRTYKMRSYTMGMVGDSNWPSEGTISHK